MKRFTVLVICLAFILGCATYPTPVAAKSKKAKTPTIFFVSDEVKYKNKEYRITRATQARECVERTVATYYQLRKKDITPATFVTAKDDDKLLAGAMLKVGEHYKVEDEVSYGGEPCTVLAVMDQEECAEDGWAVFTTYRLSDSNNRSIDVREDSGEISLKLRRK